MVDDNLLRKYMLFGKQKSNLKIAPYNFNEIICIFEIIFIIYYSGKCYFRGPWLVPPPEVPHAQSRLFYPQEVFLSTLHDCSPLVGIVGRCAVMELKDYVTSMLYINFLNKFTVFHILLKTIYESIFLFKTILGRLTEIPESDVYVVESVYDEVKRQIRKLAVPGLRKFIHSNAVTPDEIYFFPKTICPPKVIYNVYVCICKCNVICSIYIFKWH